MPKDNPAEPSTESALLRAAETLVYGKGVHATSMDDIVKASGVARKTIYRLYPTKEALIAQALRQRDERWMQWFIQATSQQAEPVLRLLAIFPALREWFASENFRGCAFINVASEIYDQGSELRAVAREHKQNLLAYLRELTHACRLKDADAVAQQYLVLIDGAITVALVTGDTDAAATASETARTVLACAIPRNKPDLVV